MAADIRRVDRIAADGTLTYTVLGRHEIPATRAKYGDSIETQTIAEMGTQAIAARSLGSYGTDEVVIAFEAIRYHSEVHPLLQPSGFGNEKIPIVVGFAHPDLGATSDLLDLCRYVKSGPEYVNDNSVRVIETTWTTDQIYWGNERKTRNQLDMSIPLGVSFFQ